MRFGKVKVRNVREPSLLRKFVDICWERAMAKRAVRELRRQEWSFDFLSLLLVKASRDVGTPLSLTVTDRSGVSYTLAYDRAAASDAARTLDDSVFDHLDDDLAVNEFIRRNSTR